MTRRQSIRPVRTVRAFTAPTRSIPTRGGKRRFSINRTKILAITASFLLVSLLGMGILAFGLFAYFAKDLPSPDKLTNRSQSLSTKILDRNGKLLYDIYGEENRVLVTLDDLPPMLVDATLAAEDAEFYQHRGFDIPGIVRSVFQIVLKGNLQGGSTLTQQVVKNTLLTTERTLPRKVKELILSVQIENRYSKQEILQMYFNEAPYGGQAWGVEAASLSFFGKSVREVTPSEAVFLAGMPQSPSAYLADPAAAEDRRLTVINLMEKNGWVDAQKQHHTLSKEEAESLRKDVPKIAAIRQSIRAPHFVWHIRNQLEERYGKEMVQGGGLKVTTTLDLELQDKMQEIVTDEVAKAKGLLVGNGALVALKPDSGEILAMVGSHDYFDEEHDGNVNVTTRQRQPGSALKPLVYVTGFKKGYSPSTMLMDVLTPFPGGANLAEYKPQNYDGKYRGPVQVRYALANSLNVPAVKMTQLVGIDAVLQTAYDMGLSTLAPTAENRSRLGLSVSLGGGDVTLLEMTGAYSVFANKGVKQDIVGILKVEDREGEVLDEFKLIPGKQVLTPEDAYLISHILSDDPARAMVFGTGSLLKIPGYDVAAKTGTTDDKRDNYAMGYTPEIAIGAWVGNNDNTPMHPTLSSGVTGASPIWHRAMQAYLSGKPNKPFERPSGIVQEEVDKLSGKKPSELTEETRTEIFSKSNVPAQVDDVHIELEICEEDENLANDDCIDDGNSETKTFIVIKELREEWQPAVDEWIKENKKDDEAWNPPEDETDYESDGDEKKTFLEVIGGLADPTVSILSPEEGATLGESITVSAKVNAPYTVTKVEFYVNDILGAVRTSIPYSAPLKLASAGEYRITVKGYDAAGGVGEEEIRVKRQ